MTEERKAVLRGLAHAEEVLAGIWREPFERYGGAQYQHWLQRRAEAEHLYQHLTQEAICAAMTNGPSSPTMPGSVN
jgi:hypothetical protein